MNKKTIISASNNTIFKLRVLAKEKESIRLKLAATAEKLSFKAEELAMAIVEKKAILASCSINCGIGYCSIFVLVFSNYNIIYQRKQEGVINILTNI